MNKILSTISISLLLLVTAFHQQSNPRLFVIGDSISIQYGTYLEQYLEGKLIYQRKQDDGGAPKDLEVPETPNGGDSRMVVEYLKVKLQDPSFSPNYLLINCGLHDIKRNPESNRRQVSPEAYRKNLTSILDLSGSRQIQVIWVRTTQVIDSIHNARQSSFHRYAEDLSTYNQIADQVMASRQIPIIDLYEFTRILGAEQFIDHVHYNEATRKLQAAFIAGFLENLRSKS
ncbi:MAG: hypothetical protein DHS20C17_23050 [Cyclobacteriaceae bacterium]|nr:MAG: hypothetical protein DHS20C17_23050 [Cyclobacteriaceae bacterium]